MGIFCNKIPKLCQLILSKYYECSQNAPLIIKALQSSVSKKVMQQRSRIWVGVKVSQLLLQICYYQELGIYVLIIIIPVFLLYVHFLLLFFQYLFCFVLCVCSKTSTIFNNCLLWEMGCSTSQSCYNYFKDSQCIPSFSEIKIEHRSKQLPWSYSWLTFTLMPELELSWPVKEELINLCFAFRLKECSH